MKKISVFSLLYIFVVLFLFLYSYTQVDLSLTLSRVSLYQYIEKSFQYIGYFQRPLSASLYVLLLILLFSFYAFFLTYAAKNKITYKHIWLLIITITIILTFSYNAFSYDLFNYIFDAKIITHYHQNPYLHKALDYPNDPMLSFMHWTQRTYPYGPVWLVATVPLSFVGLQIFIVTFFLFKILISFCYIGTVFFIGKILQKIRPKETIFGIILFALNPLVIIESLVSAHNDIMMMFLSVLAVWCLINKEYIRSYLYLLLTIAVKFATVFLVPIFLYLRIFKNNSMKVNWDKIFVIMAIVMIIPIILASYRTNYQPWYLLYCMPWGALIGKKYYTIIPMIMMSLFSLLQYLPFLYEGNWNPPIPGILFSLTTLGVVLTCCLIFIAYLRSTFKKSTQG